LFNRSQTGGCSLRNGNLYHRNGFSCSLLAIMCIYRLKDCRSCFTARSNYVINDASSVASFQLNLEFPSISAHMPILVHVCKSAGLKFVCCVTLKKNPLRIPCIVWIVEFAQFYWNDIHVLTPPYLF
jgi:hypothetical protein